MNLEPSRLLQRWGKQFRLSQGEQAIDSPNKIVLIDPSGTLERTISNLSAKGYVVDWYKDPLVILEKLKTADTPPYALAIAVYMIPEMKGDETLRRIKDIFPEIQRILVADQRDMERFVHGINSASIHACMAFPFKDEDFLSQVSSKFGDFKRSQKLKTLQNTIQRQNEQLYEIAEHFQKKKELYASQLDKKEKEIRIVESRLKSNFGASGTKRNVDLKEVLARKKVRLNPVSIKDAYVQIHQQIHKILELSFSKNGCLLDLSDPAREAASSGHDAGSPLAEQFLQLLLNLINFKETESENIYESLKGRDISEYIELRLSDNNDAAYVSLKHEVPQLPSLFQIKRFIEKNRIIFGLVKDHIIEEWLYDEENRKAPLKIAQGKEPVPPKDGRITYFFPENFLLPGKVNKDGRIDFRDRGEIPFISENVLLASKTAPEMGEDGIDVHGEKIVVDEPIDPLFSAGIGTRLSQDETKIYSTTSGHPHQDFMGQISVNPEHYIDGDIDYKTGNIDFEGNVTVSGSVRQGFKVKCTSLTANEINGAEIDLSGDLNVSLGIVDTDLVNVKGTVQAKFVRNSKIHAFGDLRVQKEIVDSQIYLSGQCLNERGLIVNSEISAKLGIFAGTVGNNISDPSALIVGIDEPVNQIVERIDAKLARNQETLNALNAQSMELEDENQRLHAIISQEAHVQDRSQLEINSLEKKRMSSNPSGQAAKSREYKRKIEALLKKAKQAEESINEGFRRQDEISLDLSNIQLTVNELEDQNKQYINEKLGILKAASKTEPLTEISVSKYVEARTKILTDKASKILSNPLRRCLIKQVLKHSRGKKVYDIDIDRA